MKKMFSVILIFAIGLAYLYTLAWRVNEIDNNTESLASNYTTSEIYNY